jgi:hypothetical protein
MSARNLYGVGMAARRKAYNTTELEELLLTEQDSKKLHKSRSVRHTLPTNGSYTLTVRTGAYLTVFNTSFNLRQRNSFTGQT